MSDTEEDDVFVRERAHYLPLFIILPERSSTSSIADDEACTASDEAGGPAEASARKQEVGERLFATMLDHFPLPIHAGHIVQFMSGLDSRTLSYG